MNYKEAKLLIESRNGVITIDGWAEDGLLWNGWSYVLMNKENAMKLARELEDVIRYDKSTDEFVEVFNKGEHEIDQDMLRWKGFHQEGINEKVYSIGSSYWTWTHEFKNNEPKESEFNNMHHALKEFIKYGDILVDNWDNEYPTVVHDRKYPEYLPSFDEFIMDMRQMVMQEDNEEFKKWKETIK